MGSRGRAEHGVPVNPYASDVHFGQSGDHGPRLRLPGLKHTDEHGVTAGQTGPAHRGQHRVRAELDERGDAGLVEGPDAVEEPYGLPDVPDPVVGRAHLVTGDDAPGYVGHDRNARPGVGETLRDLTELVENPVGVRRVEGPVHLQPLVSATVGAPALGQVGELVAASGEGGADRTVEGGDRDVRRRRLEERAYFMLLAAQRQHGAVREALHEPAALGNQRAGVVQAQNAGHVRGRELTDGVPAQQVRGDAPALVEAEQRDLDGEEGGLAVGGLVDQVGVVQDLGQGVVEVGIHDPLDLGEGAGVRLMRGGEFEAHPNVLAALPGEEERGAGGAGRATDDAAASAVVRDGGQTGD
ncbi:hypothetical protein GCM10022420_061910 [Streptomyces iranensis]